jgi:hypothetical protein
MPPPAPSGLLRCGSASRRPLRRADERLPQGLQCRGGAARGAQHHRTIRIGHSATVAGGGGRQGAPHAAPEPARSAPHTFLPAIPAGTGASNASSTTCGHPRRWRRLPSLGYDRRQRCRASRRPALPAPPAVGEQAGGGALVRAAGDPSWSLPHRFSPAGATIALTRYSQRR